MYTEISLLVEVEMLV